MTCRLLWAGLLVVLLGSFVAVHPACAKPPDLPLDQNNTVKPEVVPEDGSEVEDAGENPEIDVTAVPVIRTPMLDGEGCWVTPLSRAAKLFYRLPAGERRNLAKTILFTFHPLLVLTPTQWFLDTPNDHPVPVGMDKDDWVRAMPEGVCQEDITCCGSFGPRFIQTPKTFALWNTWRRRVHLLTQLQAAQPLPDSPNPLARLDSTAPEAIPCPDSACTPPTPKTTSCPWHPQPIVDRYAQQLADPGVTRDVLTSMECIQEARQLLERGELLGRSGHLCEALDCFQMVEELCPGRFDDRIQTIMTELCVRLYSTPRDEDEIASQPESEGSACPKCEQMHRRCLARRALKGNRTSTIDKNADDDDVCATRTEVTALLKACRLALADGRYARAADLARQACALDPERVLADPLVYKMQLLTDAPGKTCDGASEESAQSPATCPFLATVATAKSGTSTYANLLKLAAVCKELGELLDTLLPGHGGVEIGLGFPPGQVSIGYSLPLGDYVVHLHCCGGSVSAWLSANSAAKER